jgi:hypothetical protein
MKMAILGIAVLAVIAVALLPSPGLVMRQAQSTEASPQTAVQNELVTEPIYTNVTVVSEQIYANVTVVPEHVVANLSQTFKVEVWINNITGMAGWEIRLVWNRDIIKCLKAQINTPPEWGGVAFDWFNKSESDVDPNAVYTAWQFAPGIENDYNDTCGRYFKAECYGPRGSDYHNTFNGSIPVVILIFQASQIGSTSLILYKTQYDRTSKSLIDREGIKIGDRNANPIASISYNGFVEVQAP